MHCASWSFGETLNAMAILERPLIQWPFRERKTCFLMTCNESMCSNGHLVSFVVVLVCDPHPFLIIRKSFTNKDLILTVLRHLCTCQHCLNQLFVLQKFFALKGTFTLGVPSRTVTRDIGARNKGTRARPEGPPHHSLLHAFLPSFPSHLH